MSSIGVLITFIIFHCCLCNIYLSSELPKVLLHFRDDLADKEIFNDTHAVLTNSNPVFTLNCSAGYPIDWNFRFHENDDGASFKKTAIAERKIQIDSFDDISQYKYHIDLEIQYTGKIQVFTTFTCNSVKDEKLVTKVSTWPEGNHNELVVINIEPNYIPTGFTERGNQSLGDIQVSCPIYVTVTDVDVPMRSTCWSCVLPNNDEKFLDFISCYSVIECRTLFYQQNKARNCLKILDPSELPEDYAECSPVQQDRYNPYIVLCKNQGPALSQLFFFGVPKGPRAVPKTFFGWDEVITEEMVYLHPFKEPRLYFNQTLKLTCEISSFYCAYGAVFSVVWNNSTRQIINGLRDEEHEKVECGESRKGTYKVTQVIQLSNTGNVTFTCHAPVWNSTEWINSSLSFEAVNGTTPSILFIGSENSKNSFDVDDRNSSVVCRFTGFPVEEVLWTFPHQNLQGFYQVDTKLESNFSILYIPVVSSNLAGEYKCTVRSFLGVNSKSFSLQIGRAPSSMYIWGAVIFLVGVVCVAGIFIVKLIYTLKEQKERLRSLTEVEVQEFIQGNPELARQTVIFNDTSAIQALPYNTDFEIAIDQLEIGEAQRFVCTDLFNGPLASPKTLKIELLWYSESLADYQSILGKGQFGTVFKGKVGSGTGSAYYANIADDSPNTDELQVAVKTVHPDVDVEYFKALLSEIKIMVHIGSHTNIVGIVGACTENIRQRQVYVAIELCTRGSLFHFLRERRNLFENYVEYGKLIPDLLQAKPIVTSGYVQVETLTTVDLFKWTHDIAKGLSFIQEKKVIHGDLATRNVLLSAGGHAKIGDFGLARQLVDSSNYVKKTKVALPWRSMSPESLRDLTFSPKSDVWSFGVTLWEIFTLSEVPFGAQAYDLIFIAQLVDGIRLHKPVYATNDMYEFMLRCWAIAPEDRPAPYEVQSLCEHVMQCANPEE